MPLAEQQSRAGQVPWDVLLCRWRGVASSLFSVPGPALGARCNLSGASERPICPGFGRFERKPNEVRRLADARGRAPMA